MGYSGRGMDGIVGWKAESLTEIHTLCDAIPTNLHSKNDLCRECFPFEHNDYGEWEQTVQACTDTRGGGNGTIEMATDVGKA